jgi:predicted metal-dependent phosphoesterase TrpH
MGFLIDAHLHTRRHSRCSRLDESKLVRQAIQKGLQGLVITEHHYQWPAEELQALLEAAGETSFTLLAGFELTTAMGDILIYGLDATQVADFPPREDPEVALARAKERGAVCFAAHPTRAGLGFDERIAKMAFDGLETGSVNLKPHEQRLALKLADALNCRPTVSSDAHTLEDLGAYALRFDAPVLTMTDFCDSVRCGTFRPAAGFGRLAAS